MFDSLDEQMKRDEDKVTSPKERIMRWVIYLIAGLVIFGGVVMGVRSLS
jgi:hypothetical protein